MYIPGFNGTLYKVIQVASAACLEVIMCEECVRLQSVAL